MVKDGGAARADRGPGGARGTGSGGWGLLFLLVAGFLPQGCAPPDRPPLLPGQVPEDLAATLPTAEIRRVSAAPGVSYFGLRTPEEPWAIHLLRVDLERCELGLRVLTSPRQEGMAGGRTRTTELLARGGESVVAGVNGDFFTPEGLTVGTEVVAGEVRRIRSRPAFAWRPGILPWMGMPQAEGDSVLVLGWDVDRRASDGTTEALGGFPLLLHDGGRVGDLLVGENPSFAAARHPRTALGLDPRRGHLWVVVVDGRQPGYSDGMTLPELATLLENLGVTEAINLDGGGSSVMVVEGATLSRPSDAEGERPVVNALAVVREQAFCRIGL